MFKELIHKVQTIQKSFTQFILHLSLVRQLIFGATILCLVIGAFILTAHHQPTGANLVAAKHTVTAAPTVTQQSTATATMPANSSTDAAPQASEPKPSTPAPAPAPAPKPAVTTPTVTPGSLTLSSDSVTVGPNQPGSITVTPSAGSMFYTISVQSVVNISCDVSVLNNVTAPFTIHYSYPTNGAFSPTPGTQTVTIVAQDQTKATHTYSFQLTVLPANN